MTFWNKAYLEFQRIEDKRREAEAVDRWRERFKNPYIQD